MLNNEKYIPYEIEKYIYTFIPIEKCCLCGKYFINYDKNNYFCGKKCKYIFISGFLSKAFLSINQLNIQLMIIIFLKFVALLGLSAFYLTIKIITISTGLIIYNFNIVLLNHYFIEDGWD